jgi:glycosyltransferase involved in cell wall biosynthesis
MDDPDFYRSVDAMVLASREEGLALVLSQGLATGLPIVCTNDTGGADLRHTSTLDDRIQVVPSGDPVALAQAMKNVAQRLRDGPAFAELTEADRDTLTWRACAKRYEANLDRLLNGLQ